MIGQEVLHIKLLIKKITKHMYKYFILIFFFLNFNASAEIVKKLEVTGNSRISKETIKVYGEISFNEDYSSIKINTILKNLYETDFFEDIQIILNKGTLNISVKEYPVINSIDLRGEKSSTIKKKVLDTLMLKVKESFIENKLNNDIDTLKKVYASIGFNFATVEAKLERFDNNRINLVYFLEKGKKTNIGKISFIGDKKIKEKRLRDVISSEENKFWKFLSRNTFLSSEKIELDKRLLTNYYKSLGYYDVQVLSSNAEVSSNDSTSLIFTINAGTRYKINKISTNVSDVLDKKLFLPLQKNFVSVVGKYYSPFKVKKLLDDLDILIASNDLQFIEHSVNEIIDNDTIEIKINIFEGKKQLVEKIMIYGNTVTQESVIRSELLLDEGDPFNSLKLTQSIAKLKARNIFSEVTQKIIEGTDKEQKIIEISVKEKPTGEISAGAGIGTSGGSFQFTVRENNWLGKGISTAVSLELGAETFQSSLEVTDPNYNFSGNSLTYFAKNTTNDKADSGFKNNIMSLGIGTRFEQYRDVYLSPNLMFSYDNLEVLNTASAALQKQKGTFTDLSFDYGISIDKRDRAFAPTDGYVSSFAQAIPIYADSPYIKNKYSYSGYQALTPDAIGRFKFNATSINGLSNEDVRLSKRLFLSSANIRGFERGKVGPKDGKDFVGGNYAMTANFELALPKLLPESTKTDVGIFLDFGNLWEVDYNAAVDDSNKIRSTAGVNASWISPVGPMSFVFSQNITQASTDITESFSFRLGTTF
jgi:outer membrane protein insertion porin family